jgi:hypothetical protein
MRLMPVRAYLHGVVQGGKWLWSFERMTALLGALFAVLSFLAVVYFGFYPRPPIEAPLDPDTLYRDGAAVGHVVEFRVEPLLAGQYVFRVGTSNTIAAGDVLRFRHATCFVVGISEERSADSKIIFNGINCRVVSG